MSEVLLLNKEELVNCVPLDLKAVECVEQAFHTLATENVIMPPIMQLDVRENNGEVCIKTAYLPGLDHFAIKISPGFFDNPKIGLPSGSGMMNVFNSKTGILEAVLLDKGYLTDVRTAAAGAVAAKWLSREDSETVTLVGAGVQARLQLEALALVRNIKKVVVWARDHGKAIAFADSITKETNFSVSAEENIKLACAPSDIIITTTPAEQPLIRFSDLQAGQHITAMGSDAERKTELDPDVLVNADRYICDRLSQVRALGELHHAIDSGCIDENQEFDELGDIIAGKSIGRTTSSEITVCDLTGTGAQDTAIAHLALSLAIDKGFGTPV
jgi:ornithine cyclodeaminase